MSLFSHVKKAFNQEWTPDSDWMKEALADNILTPDRLFLERKEHQLLFVYGTQMRGHPQHELINNLGAYAALGFSGERFTLWKKRLGNESFPIALENSGWRRPDWNIPPRAKVQGELYAIETGQLVELDKHYQNTLEFERKRIHVIIPYHSLYRVRRPSNLQEQVDLQLGIKDSVVTTHSKVSAVRAWMYIGTPTYWSDQLDHLFSPVSLYKPNQGWLGDYYSFTRQEYDDSFHQPRVEEPRFSWTEYQNERQAKWGQYLEKHNAWLKEQEEAA